MRSVDVPIANLPAALHGFTIAQISDVHIGTTIKGRHLDAIVDAVNELNADMVAITGDLVDGSVAELAAHTAALSRAVGAPRRVLRHRQPRILFGRARVDRRDPATRPHVLMNEHVVLQHEGADVVVAGVTDFSAGHFDAAQRSDPAAARLPARPRMRASTCCSRTSRARRSRRTPQATICNSRATRTAASSCRGIFSCASSSRFTAGLHRLGELWVYVSRGTGYWGPPKRLGAPSEITRLTLVPGVTRGRGPQQNSRLSRYTRRSEPITFGEPRWRSPTNSAATAIARPSSTSGRRSGEEPALEPDLPIVDPHHHVWDDERGRYLLHELAEDVEHRPQHRRHGVHRGRRRCTAPTAPRPCKPVGEVEFVNGIAAMSASGRYGKARLCAGIVGHADLMLGDAARPVLEALIAAGNGRFRGIRYGAIWDTGNAAKFGRRQVPRHQVLDPVFRKGFAHLQPLGLSFESWLFHPQLADVADLLRAFPGYHRDPQPRRRPARHPAARRQPR